MLTQQTLTELSLQPVLALFCVAGISEALPSSKHVPASSHPAPTLFSSAPCDSQPSLLTPLNLLLPSSHRDSLPSPRLQLGKFL